MAFEDIQAEIGLLLTKMQNKPADRYELYQQIMQKLNELQAYGMPLPDDLVRLERDLEAEFEAEREARARAARRDRVVPERTRRRR